MKIDGRSVLRGVAVVAVSLVFVPVIGQFFIAVGEELGWYRHPTAQVAKLLLFLREQPVVHWIGGVGIGFALGVFAATSNSRAAQPEPHKWVNEADVKRLQLTVKRMSEFAQRYSDQRGRSSFLTASSVALHSDEHEVWLDDRLRLARDQFLDQINYVVGRMDGQNHPGFRNEMERSETMLQLRDAAKRLEEGLSGRPMSKPFDPYD